MPRIGKTAWERPKKAAYRPVDAVTGGRARPWGCETNGRTRAHSPQKRLIRLCGFFRGVFFFFFFKSRDRVSHHPRRNKTVQSSFSSERVEYVKTDDRHQGRNLEFSSSNISVCRREGRCRPRRKSHQECHNTHHGSFLLPQEMRPTLQIQLVGFRIAVPADLGESYVRSPFSMAQILHHRRPR